MVQFPRWQTIAVLLVCVLGLLLASPNLVSEDVVESLPDWLPAQQVNLGLDLRGGSHLLLKVETDAVVREDMEALVDEVRAVMRQARIGYRDLGATAGAVTLTLRDPAQARQAREALASVAETHEVTVSGDGAVRIAMLEQAALQRRSSAVEQSIEILARRVNELGTREPIIQRQGEDRIIVQVPGLDDPQRLKGIIGTTAKMTFHLLDPNTPRGVEGMQVPAGAMLLPSVEKTAAGQSEAWYVVRRKVEVSGDRLLDAQPTFSSQTGEAVVSFRFDSVGARQFGAITQAHVGEPFAIVLDDEVISAPVIREPILGGNGQISGNFTTDAANDLALLLRAGALPAPLTILEERTVGPSLGADSIAAGEIAAVIGFAAVIVFMVLAYGLFGIFANIALIANVILLMAALSALQATLTLPGIAGIVLTMGMAVDANVLIFERIREEVRLGRSPISAIDTGFRQAFGTIFDSNITTLIAGIVLFGLGSGPIRGFAVTLSLGIITSVFSAIMISRLLIVMWLRRTRPRTIPI